MLFFSQHAQQQVEQILAELTDSKNKLAYDKGKLQVSHYLLFGLFIVGAHLSGLFNQSFSLFHLEQSSCILFCTVSNKF